MTKPFFFVSRFICRKTSLASVRDSSTRSFKATLWASSLALVLWLRLPLAATFSVSMEEAESR